MKQILLVAIGTFTLLTGCTIKNIPSAANSPIQFPNNELAVALSQKIMLDLRYYCGDKNKITTTKTCTTPMTELPLELATMITQSNLGGVILFLENLQNTQQIVKLNHDLQQAAYQSTSKTPLFISVDQEGGRVVRLPRSTSTSFSGNMAIGATYEKHGTKYATIVGDILGAELSATGFNVNHAPTVDVNVNPDNPVINVRSFGEDPTKVAQLGLEQIKAMQKHKVIGTLKHFPGHGDTSVDSHTGLPRVEHQLSEIVRVDLAPFQYAIDQKQVDMIMTAHIQYPELDNSTFVSKNGDTMMKPATMSRKILTSLLRDDMKYQGLVITDALDMKGISAFFTETEAVIETFKAGSDIALMPFKIRYKQDIIKLQQLIQSLTVAVEQGILNKGEVLQSYNRIIRIKDKYQIARVNKTALPTKTEKALSVLANKKHRRQEQALSDNAITLIKGNGQIPNHVKSLHLLMPDSSKCVALTEVLQSYRPDLMLSCSSVLSSDEQFDKRQIKQVDAILAANVTPKQSLVEMGGMDDMAALTAKYGNLSQNKQRIDNKIMTLMRFAKYHNKHITFVSLRMPYEVKSFGIDADSVIATYAYNQYKDHDTGKISSSVYTSLAKLLTGNLTPTGALPVSISKPTSSVSH